MRVIRVPDKKLLLTSPGNPQPVYEGLYFWFHLQLIVGRRLAQTQGHRLLDLHDFYKEIKPQWLAQPQAEELTIAKEDDYRMLLQWVDEHNEWIGDDPMEAASSMVRAFHNAEIRNDRTSASTP